MKRIRMIQILCQLVPQKAFGNEETEENLTDMNLVPNGQYTGCPKSSGTVKYLAKYGTNRKSKNIRVKYFLKPYPMTPITTPYPHPLGVATLKF